MPDTPTPAARLRGASAGALTLLLTVAAHAAAGGGLPSGAAAALLALTALTVGALAAAGATVRFWHLVALLAAGQLLGHAVLGAVGHQHAASGSPWGPMLAGHAVAVGVGALLIAIGGHLCDAVSRVLRAPAAAARRPIASPPAVAGEGSDQPLHSALLLAASVSHRGPPVSPAR